MEKVTSQRIAFWGGASIFSGSSMLHTEINKQINTICCFP